MYDKKARTAVAVRALFAAFSWGADQQSANANIPVFDVCSVICCFSALFLRKNPAESIALCGIFNILLVFFFGGAVYAGGLLIPGTCAVHHGVIGPLHLVIVLVPVQRHAAAHAVHNAAYADGVQLFVQLRQ